MRVAALNNFHHRCILFSSFALNVYKCKKKRWKVKKKKKKIFFFTKFAIKSKEILKTVANFYLLFLDIFCIHVNNS